MVSLSGSQLLSVTWARAKEEGFLTSIWASGSFRNLMKTRDSLARNYVFYKILRMVFLDVQDPCSFCTQGKNVQCRTVSVHVGEDS